MASVDANDLPSAVEAVKGTSHTPEDVGRPSSPKKPASGQRDSLEQSADGITTAIDNAAALPDDGELPTEGGRKGLRTWCCSTRKRAQHKSRKEKKQSADTEKICSKETVKSTKLSERLMEMILRQPAPPALVHAAPPRTNTGMCLDSPGLAAASPSVGRTFHDPISKDVIPSGAFLDGPGYNLGFSVNKTGHVEDVRARLDQVERKNEAAKATLLQLQEKAARIEELQEKITVVEVETSKLRAEVAAETSRADDNAAGAAYWKHRSGYLENDHNATMRRLRNAEDSVMTLLEQNQGKETELQAEMTALKQEVQALQNKLQKETAHATKHAATCDIIKVAVKKARMTMTATQLELKNQRALVSKLRREKQELHVSTERHALNLSAKLAAFTAEGDKQVNLLIQQRDKTQAAADVALAKLHECEQKLQQETERAKQSNVQQREPFRASIAKARMCTSMTELELNNQKALVSKLRFEKQELKASAERQALELTSKLAAITAEGEKQAQLLIEQRDKTQAAADVALAKLHECEQKMHEEKERAKQSSVKQREILKDSIAKARACTTLAEQQLEGQTALASQLQLEMEELKAAVKIQLTELEVRLFQEAIQVVVKAQDERDAWRDEKMREHQRAERYCRERNKKTREIKAMKEEMAELKGRLAGQKSPEDNGKRNAAYKLLRQEVEEERAARQAAEAEVARLKSEQESNRAGCEESKGSEEETAGLRHQLQQCEAALNFQYERANRAEAYCTHLQQQFNNRGPQDMPVGPAPAESELQLSLNNMHAQVLDLQTKLAQQEERYAAKDTECMGHWQEKQCYMLQVVNTESKAKREAEALKQARDELAAKCAALTEECARLDANQLELLDCLRGVDGELGKGGQAVVKSMTIKDEDGTEKKVALKVFKFHAHPTREFKMGELASLTGFAPKVEQLIECKKVVARVSRGDEPIGGVVRMEYLEGRTLMQIIRELRGQSMSLSMLDGIVFNMNEFFKKCVQCHLLHRDIKPDNIMLLADDSLKVIDYAYAKLHADSTLPLEEQFVTNGGHTPSFMAPEALTKKKGYRDDIAVDMFAAGVVCVTCALGKFNFFDREYFDLIDHFTALQFQGTPLPSALGGLTAATAKFYDVFERQRERIEGLMEAKVAQGKVSQTAAHMLQYWVSQDQAIRRQTLEWKTAEMFGRA